MKINKSWLIIIVIVIMFFLGYAVGLFFQANFITSAVDKQCNDFICEEFPNLCNQFNTVDPFVLLENGSYDQNI